MQEYSTWSLIRDLSPYLKPHRARLITATLCRAISDIAWLYPAYALALLTNFLTGYEPGDSLSLLWILGTVYLVAILLRHGGAYTAKRLGFTASERLMIDAQKTSMAHLFKLDISWHERENTGNKLKKIVRGSEGIDRIIRIWINNLIEITVNFIGIIYIISHFDYKIAILTFIFLATYYVLAHFFRKQAARTTAIANTQEEEVQGVLFEALNNIRSVKVLGMAEALFRVLVREWEDLFAKSINRIFWFLTGNSVSGLYAQLFAAGMMVYIVLGILHGQYELGFLILFYGYFGNLLQSVSELASVAQDFVVAKISVRRMFEVLKEPIGIEITEGKVDFPKDWKKISFRNVSFGYGDNEVLQDVSFDIHRGERVGIVGLSGAGKSTLFKLLLKEHESYTGEILVDDVPLTRINKQDYFSHSAVVLQDTEVFNFTLRDNITLANSAEAGNAELFEKALRVSHVEDFVSRLPDGVETRIGEKGVRLSGGEKQRVGIARAVFKDPELLLLDEATSHLDIESEEKIRASLHEFFRGVTAVVIAHRLTTIKEMDRIIVLEGGKIIESGSFDMLYAQQGRFFDLWEKQRL